MLNREYEYVAAIAQEGTLSGAAVRLGVTQPALTRFLKKEEAELGTPLFQRINNRMVPTYAGECYLDYVKQIFTLQERMMATLSGIARSDLGRLRVGIPSIRRPFTIFSVIPQFKKKYPNVDLTLSECSSDDLEQMLEELTLDCIAVNVTKRREDFDYTLIAEEEYVLAVHADDPLVKCAEPVEGFRYPAVKPEALANRSFVMPSRAYRVRRFANSILEGRRIPYHVSMTALNLDSALEAVSNNLGVTITPEVPLSYVRGSKDIRYLSIDTPGTTYQFCLACRKGAQLAPCAKDFIEMFRAAFREQDESRTQAPIAMNDYLSQERTWEALDVSNLPRQRRGLTYPAPDGSNRIFDLYYPTEGKGPFPLIVNISGGGWYFGHPSSVQLGRTLHSSVHRGYAFASLAITSSGEQKFPYQIQEAKAALRHLRRHAQELNIDEHFLCLWSFSSGGHLSLMAALTPDNDYFDCEDRDIPTHVDAIAAMYPCLRLDVTAEDFRRIGLEPENKLSGLHSAEAFFLGVPPEDAPELCARAAPINYLRSDAPPLMLLHGTDDRVVPYTGSLEFARRYREIAGKEKLLTRFVRGAVHSDVRFKGDAICAEVLDFFDRVRLGQTPCPLEQQGVDL